MKNKKGFTLIELLAVIVILAIIALIAVPVIMNIISKANKSAFKDTVYGVISAGELYFSEQQLDVNGMEEDKTFDFADKNNGLQIKGALPQSGSMIVNKEGKVAIAASNGRYCVTKGFNDTDVTVTENVENCKNPEGPKTLSDLAINLTPEAQACLSKGTTCDVTEKGIMFTLKANKEDEAKTQNFYVIADDGNKITLIMDRNLGDNVEWYDTEKNNSKGPLTALNYLNELTDKEWSNIPMREYTYSDDSGENKYSIEEPYLMRARMITYTEVDNIIAANNGTMPKWLYINLRGTGDDSTAGYWTSTAYDNPSYNGANSVIFTGNVVDSSTLYTGYGLRPVIELSK